MQGNSPPRALAAGSPEDILGWSIETGVPAPVSGLFETGAPKGEDRMACLVHTLQYEIIPRLIDAHRSRGRLPASNDELGGTVSQSEVEEFTRGLIHADDFEITAVVATLRERGLGVERVFVDLLAPSARLLGHLWTEDLCYFTDVTIGLGRLQRIMRELSPAFGTEVAHAPNGRRVLLVRAPGEQHSFGMSMVAEFFRRAGWEVASAGEGEDTDPVTAVRREWFDVVGFSAGSEARLDWLPACISAVRRASCHRDIAVLVGGPVFTLRPQLARQVGADATTADGSEAPGLAESLLAGRVKRS